MTGLALDQLCAELTAFSQVAPGDENEAAQAIRALDAGHPIPSEVDFPGLDDGIKGMAFIEAAVESAAARAAWVRPRFV